MTKSLKITLSDAEIILAKNLASIRSASKEHLDEFDSRTSANPSSYERHFLGLRGEIAVAKVLSTVIDSRTNSGDSNAGDVITADGKTVQVKTRSRNTSDRVFRLRSDDISEFKSDFGILCVEHSQKVIELYGWFSKETFLAKHVAEDKGWGLKECLYPEHYNLFSVVPFAQSPVKLSKEEMSFVFEPIIEIIETLNKNLEKQSMNRDSAILLLQFMGEAVQSSYLRFGGFETKL